MVPLLHARPLPIVVEQESDLARMFRSNFQAVQRHFRREASLDGSLKRQLQYLERRTIPYPGTGQVQEDTSQASSGFIAAAPGLASRVLTGDIPVVVATVNPAVSGGSLSDLYPLTTAFSVAHRLEQLTQRPAAVVAWLGRSNSTPTDYVGIDDGGHPVSLQRADSPAGVFGALLGDAPYAGMVGDSYGRALGSFWNGTADILQADHERSRAFRQGYGRLLLEFFAGHNLVVVDEESSCVSRTLAPFFKMALSRSSALNRAMRARATLLRREGMAVQPPPLHQAHVRYIPGGRSGGWSPYQVELHEGRAVGYSNTERPAFSYSLQTFLRVLKQAPERFLPDSLLRPLAQAWMFPVVALVVGPDQLGDQALVEESFDLVELRAPVAILAQRFLLVPHVVHELMEEYQLSLEDVWNDLRIRRDRLVQRADRLNIPVRERQLHQDLDRVLDGATLGLETLDSSLTQEAARLRDNMERQIHDFFELVQQVHRRTQRQVFRDFRYIENWLRPDGDAQWNRFCPLPFLAHYGPDFLAALCQLPPDPIPQFIQLHQNPA